LPLGPQLKKDYPEVEEMVRFVSRERALFKNGESSFYETKAYYADSTIFKVFSHRFIEGSAGTSLQAPFDIVPTKSLAEKYFGKAIPAAGKTLKTVYDTYRVTGVIEITRNYLWLALLSALIAFPMAWYFMNNWLKVFPYNMGLIAVPFAVSALVILITAIATAVFYSAKAALANPVNNLRTE
jgi:putative ABC transport system permease protein